MYFLRNAVWVYIFICVLSILGFMLSVLEQEDLAYLGGIFASGNVCGCPGQGQILFLSQAAVIFHMYTDMDDTEADNVLYGSP